MGEEQAAGAGRHAGTGVGSGAEVAEPSYAERTRTLVSLTPMGTLATMSRRCAGFPFGSLMPFGLDGEGRPLFLISTMAMHTQNLMGDARCSLFVAQAAEDGDPLGAARATLVGEARPVGAEDAGAVREVYVARHPNSRYWVDFPDFKFYRLEVAEIYYVGGFGVMGWVDAGEYKAAEADPLAGSAAGILAHMNADHVDSMILLAREHAGLEAAEAAMTSVDRLGFTLRLKTAEGMKGTRINFPGEVRTAQETRKALVTMVRGCEARRG